MKSTFSKKLASTAMAATLGTFFVMSSFVDANAHYRRYGHNHGRAAAGFIAGVVVGGAIAAGSNVRYRKHRHRHCHRNKRGRIYKCHRHRHSRRHHR